MYLLSCHCIEMDQEIQHSHTSYIAERRISSLSSLRLNNFPHRFGQRVNCRISFKLNECVMCRLLYSLYSSVSQSRNRNFYIWTNRYVTLLYLFCIIHHGKSHSCTGVFVNSIFYIILVTNCATIMYVQLCLPHRYVSFLLVLYGCVYYRRTAACDKCL